MIVGVPRETAPGEARVAITPATVALLVKNELDVIIEQSAGWAAGFPDSAYASKGAKIVARPEIFAPADILLQVRSTLSQADPDFASIKPACLLIGFCDPLSAPSGITTA